MHRSTFPRPSPWKSFSFRLPTQPFVLLFPRKPTLNITCNIYAISESEVSGNGDRGAGKSLKDTNYQLYLATKYKHTHTHIYTNIVLVAAGG